MNKALQRPEKLESQRQQQYVYYSQNDKAKKKKILNNNVLFLKNGQKLVVGKKNEH